MTAEQMIDQAHKEAIKRHPDHGAASYVAQVFLLRDIIRHLCDPENVPYPITSPEL